MIKKLVLGTLSAGLPCPLPVRITIRLIYKLGVLLAETWRFVFKLLIVEPVFRSVAEQVGARLRIERIPYIRGRGRIIVGSDVYISGKIAIGFSSHGSSMPEFIVGDKSFIGDECAFNAADHIRIGKECLIGGQTRIQDHDGHPIDADRRRRGDKLGPAEIGGVVIGDGVWIAPRTIILKGVQIGENTVIGAGSVVVGDIPADSVAAGNPARVIKKLR